MPSPFPGMDPYLEEPTLWPSFHQGLISLLWMELNRLLPTRYVAGMSERVYMMAPTKTMFPDVIVAKPRRKEKRGATHSAATALLECDPSVEIDDTLGEVREVFVEIQSAADPGKLVAVLEVLSPANKRAGQEGRTKYLEKQAALLASTTHLVEIDLLRAGDHTVAAPHDRLPEESWDYLVCLHRGGQSGKHRVWPTPLPGRLPRFAVPLLNGDADVVVDLQSLVNRCYEAGMFERRLDYRHKCPLPALTKANATWFGRLLRAKGLRK